MDQPRHRRPRSPRPRPSRPRSRPRPRPRPPAGRRRDRPDRSRRPAASRAPDERSAVYRALAEVEGAIHGIEPDRVELHEVGAIDSILDVVGVCAALESLAIDAIHYSPIGVGHGTVATAHGRLPNPVPAVSRAARHAQGPSWSALDTTMELATPTGVALVTVLAGAGARRRCRRSPIEGVGYGAGTADPPGRPNVVQAVVGAGAGSLPSSGRPAIVLEANVDDVTGEVLAHTIAALMSVRRLRRLGHADRDEEGSPGTHGARPVRCGDDRRCSPHLDRRVGHARRAGDGASSGGRSTASTTMSSWRATRSGSSGHLAASRSSTTTRRRRRRRWGDRCARCWRRPNSSPGRR